LIIFLPLGSTFQRTPCGDWRLSVHSGFTLCFPASTFPIIRFPCLISLQPT